MAERVFRSLARFGGQARERDWPEVKSENEVTIGKSKLDLCLRLIQSARELEMESWIQ